MATRKLVGFGRRQPAVDLGDEFVGEGAQVRRRRACCCRAPFRRSSCPICPRHRRLRSAAPGIRRRRRDRARYRQDRGSASSAHRAAPASAHPRRNGGGHGIAGPGPRPTPPPGGNTRTDACGDARRNGRDAGGDADRRRAHDRLRLRNLDAETGGEQKRGSDRRSVGPGSRLYFRTCASSVSSALRRRDGEVDELLALTSCRAARRVRPGSSPCRTGDGTCRPWHHR